MPPLRRLALALLATVLPSLALAAPAHYALDPVHTRVLFAVSHAGFSQALGTVSGSRGDLWFDPDDWSSAKLDVEAPATTRRRVSLPGGSSRRTRPMHAFAATSPCVASPAIPAWTWCSTS